jgi:hypothetical protein
MSLSRSLVPFLAFAALVLAPVPGEAAPPKSCVFTISMLNGTDVNNLDFKVNYSGADGFIGGTMTNPECVRALGGQSFASFHNDQAGTLTVGEIRLAYFSGPVDLAACRFYWDSLEPAPADFNVTVTNAGRDGEDNNVVPVPSIQVTSVECPGELPNPTTTTTLPDTTTTTLPSGSGACGFPKSDGAKPTASDALFALKAAVGAAECDLCVCDVNSSGSIAASDALGILKAAVGLEITLACPAC